MSAEYGNSAVVVNVVTKSGTNDFHGDLFEFLRNGDLNARNFFAPTQDTLKRNQFGGTVGGPILKNKLFFFFTYQGTRTTTAPSGAVSFVPTAAERTGDFSALSTQLVDPVTSAPFPNNQISRLSAPALYFLQHIPLPNGPNGQLTYLGPTARTTDNQFMPKIDYITGKNQLSGRYFYTCYTQQPDSAAGKANALATDSSGNSVRAQTVSLNERIRNRRRCCSAPGSATIVPLARLFPAHRSALPMLASILPLLAVRLQCKRLAWVDTLRSSQVTLVYSTGTIGVSAKL
ncbi:MAG TPA: hypothetical protein VKV15_20360 [Bryobacteraceae bacterium]|nr:hypothetical protein [Bryobacteraceae bacterium]